MILDDFIEIKITRRNITHYNMNYDVNPGDIIQVKIEHLPPTNKHKVKVSCDICGDIKYIEYRDYLNSFNNYGMYTCSKCSYIKNKKTNIERYGVEHTLQSKDVINKVKKTNIERYGTENVFQSDKIKEKSKQTCLKRYGVEFYNKTDEFKEKTKKTCLERYGTIHHTKLKEVQDKKRKTNLERYGVEHPAQNKEIMDKTIIKSLKTRKKTLKEKYPFIIDVSYEKNIIKACCKFGHIYEIDKGLFLTRIEYNNEPCLICNPRNEPSAGELEIKNILDSRNIKYERQKKFDDCKNRNKLPFDFYLPDYNICIEYDGRQHFNERTMYFTEDIEINDNIKTEYCKDNNIELIRIRYDENIEEKLCL